MFTITTPSIGNKGFRVEWDEDNETGKAIFDDNIFDTKRPLVTYELNKEEFDVICDICDVSWVALEHNSGFDFTATHDQLDAIRENLDA